MLRWLLILGVLCGGAAWWLTRPQRLPDTWLDGLTGDAARGAAVFYAGGCGSCHAAPGSQGDDMLVLAGGHRLESPFGTFVAPNISPSPQGVGGWSDMDLANALVAGLSPDGQHYYPAFPYTTYTRMTPQDIVDLKAYLDGLPPSDAANQPHELPFPFTIRRGLGLWKRLNLNPDWVMAEAPTDQIKRGRYLVEALGHCGACHTPRNIIGATDRSVWLTGAPNPSGKGQIPNITPAHLTWSEGDIAYYLETGFTPDFDSAGGDMAVVVSNLNQLTPDDRAAIAAYLKALPGGE